MVSKSNTQNKKRPLSDAATDHDWLGERLQLALTAHQDGNLAEAETLYLQVLEHLPQQANANHNLGILRLESAQAQASLPFFKTALEADPAEPQYWMSFIEALIQAGDYQQAQQVLDYGIEGGLQGDEIVAYQARLAQGLMLDKPDLQTQAKSPVRLWEAKSEQAKPDQVKFTKSKSGKPTAQEMNALATLFNQSHHAESEQLARQLTQHYPRHGFGWKVLGALLQGQGLKTEAYASLTKAAELLPTDAEVHYNLGNVYYDQLQLKQAAVSYRRAAGIDPRFAQAHYNLGSVYKDQGDFKQAEASYRRASALMQGNAHVHFNLGQVLAQQGKFGAAESSFLNALDIDASYVDAYYQLSIAYQQLDEPAKVELCLRKTVELKPEFTEARFNLGNHLLQRGASDEALLLYQQALQQDAGMVGAHNNLGSIYRVKGRLQDAAICFRHAINADPAYGPAHNNLGITLKDLGRFAEAKACLLQALELNPDSTETLNNIGLVLKEQGDLLGAEAAYRKALVANTDYLPALCNLGMALDAQGRFNEAEASLRAALAIKPDFAEACNNLGLVFKNQGRITEALDSLAAALVMQPDYVDALSNMGSTLKDQGRIPEAEVYFRRALEINPGYSLAYSNLLFCMTHNDLVDADTLAAEHRRYGERYEQPLKALWRPHANSKKPARCLQVGFVSADLRNHAVAYFIEPILEHLAKDPQLCLHAFANSTHYDAVSERLHKHFVHWHQVTTLSDTELAEHIRACGIDILIDLSGHTAGHRMLTFARKPAPLQATWLGYLGSTGLTAMDFYLTDACWMPPGLLDQQFTEHLLQLPAYAPFLPSELSPPVNALPALRNGYLTFGSFNRTAKLSRSVISVWSRLLRAVPDARILIAAMPADGDGGQLAAWFAEERIAADRLIFHTRSNMETYLRLHNEVDICLDTFPYNGGTTTWHAVWMGVPTVTIAGNMAQGRISTSILGQVGLEQFVASDLDDFVARASSWAQQLQALADIRHSLRERFTESPAARPDVIASSLASAFREMWGRWCRDEPAISFEVFAK